MTDVVKMGELGSWERSKPKPKNLKTLSMKILQSDLMDARRFFIESPVEYVGEALLAMCVMGQLHPRMLPTHSPSALLAMGGETTLMPNGDKHWSI